MQPMQIHEYLELLKPGCDSVTISATTTESCLRQARALWPNLGLGEWTDRKRTVEPVVRNPQTGATLVHIAADLPDCYLILSVPPKKPRADSWILFDIGAEYRELTFLCPTLDIEAPAEETTIRNALPRLMGRANPYAILEKRDGTYMQVWAEYGKYDVEHQLVSVASHYRLARQVNADAAVGLFVDYAFGKYSWATKRKWNRMDLG